MRLSANISKLTRRRKPHRIAPECRQDAAHPTLFRMTFFFWPRRQNGCFPFAQRCRPNRWEFESGACAHPGVLLGLNRPGCSPKAFGVTACPIWLSVQARKILRSDAKILLPSKPPFIEWPLAHRWRSNQNQFFILKPPKPLFHFCSRVYRLAGALPPV